MHTLNINTDIFTEKPMEASLNLRVIRTDFGMERTRVQWGGVTKSDTMRIKMNKVVCFDGCSLY